MRLAVTSIVSAAILSALPPTAEAQRRLVAAVKPGHVRAGEVFEVRVNSSNSGATAWQDARACVTAPSGVEYVSASRRVSFSRSRICAELDAVAAGTRELAVFVFRASPTARAGNRIFTATIESAGAAVGLARGAVAIAQRPARKGPGSVTALSISYAVGFANEPIRVGARLRCHNVDAVAVDLDHGFNGGTIPCRRAVRLGLVSGQGTHHFTLTPLKSVHGRYRKSGPIRTYRFEIRGRHEHEQVPVRVA